MPAASRHAKPKTRVIRLGAPVVAAATLAGVAVAFVFLEGGSAAPRPSRHAIPVTSIVTTTSAGSVSADDPMTTFVRRDLAVLAARMIQRSRTAARSEERRVGNEGRS